MGLRTLFTVFALALPLVPITQDQGDGAGRAATIAAALAGASADDLPAQLQSAFSVFVEELDAWHLKPAETIALAMHARAQAAWSASSLALLSTRLGEHERADRVLATRMEHETDPLVRLDLTQRRAIAALGAGRVEHARDLLGKALAQGGTDAYQILGREALAAGNRERARRLFGALLLPAPEATDPGTDPLDATPWALRGWGLALLP